MQGQAGGLHLNSHVSEKLPVVVNIGCQLNWIWNQLKDKLLGRHYCQGFLNRLFEVENPAYMQIVSSSGSPNKRRWKRETFACLPSLLLADSSTVLLSLLLRLHSFADVHNPASLDF